MRQTTVVDQIVGHRTYTFRPRKMIPQKSRNHGDNPSLGVNLPPMPKRTYDRYLNHKFTRETAPDELTTAWLDLPDATAANAQLPVPLREDPLQILEDLSADIDQVAGCLEAYAATLHQSHVAKNDVQVTLAASDVGGKALRWLYSSKYHVWIDSWEANRFLKMLAYSMVGGRWEEEHLWQLLLVEYVPASPNATKYQDNLWKAQLLHHLVWSHMFWSSDGNAFKSGLNALERAVQASQKAILSENPDPRIAFDVPSTSLQRFLIDVEPASIRHEDFERFSTLSAVWLNDRKTREIDKLMIDHLHPSGPNPWPVLSFLRRHGSGFNNDPALRRKIGGKRKPSNTPMWQFLVKTAQALQKQGYLANARWVIDFGRAHYPDRFSSNPQPVLHLRNLPGLR